MSDNRNIKPKNEIQRPDWLPIVLEKVRSLRYGTVEIIIHDAGVAQVVVKENIRMDKEPDAGKPKPNNLSPP